MSFFKKLFGGDTTADSSPKAIAEADYEGFRILTMPMDEGGQFRVCALIQKEVDGELKEHTLIRADTCTSKQEASDIAMRKSRQIIDERGDRVFN